MSGRDLKEHFIGHVHISLPVVLKAVNRDSGLVFNAFGFHSNDVIVIRP